MIERLFDAPPFTAGPIPDDLGYAAPWLDREAMRRCDADYVAAGLADPASRFFAFVSDVTLLKTVPMPDPLFARAELPADLFAGLDGHETIFLGRDPVGGARIYAIEASGLPENPERAMGEERALIDLRSLANQGLLPSHLLGALAGAKAMLSWHRTHRFCARCGAPSAPAQGGWKRVCTACAGEHFPRTDPVVIMLAVRGDRCLLGRQPRFPQGMYSALAGFMEPGETIEEAVRREILEEAGVRCGAVRYVGCQPWPFPMSLMIGAIAEATSEAITIDREELEDARWLTRADVAAMLEGTHADGFKAPGRIAIAHHLLRRFVEG
jgi:NAD+ diphosphatase